MVILCLAGLGPRLSAEIATLFGGKCNRAPNATDAASRCVKLAALGVPNGLYRMPTRRGTPNHVVRLS